MVLILNITPGVAGTIRCDSVSKVQKEVLYLSLSITPCDIVFGCHSATPACANRGPSALQNTRRAQSSACECIYKLIGAWPPLRIQVQLNCPIGSIVVRRIATLVLVCWPVGLWHSREQYFCKWHASHISRV